MYGLGILKGMMVTLRHLFRPTVTVQYPEEVRTMPPRARTNLVWFEERCTGCSICAQACPDGCILVATSPAEDGSLNIDRYEIDFRLCMYCGLCTEACPYEAIQAGGTWKDVTTDFDAMYRVKNALTSFAHQYLREKDYMYPHDQRAPNDHVRLIARGLGVACFIPRTLGEALPEPLNGEARRANHWLHACANDGQDLGPPLVGVFARLDEWSQRRAEGP